MPFQVLHLPLFNLQGDPIVPASDSWNLRPDYSRKVLQVRSGQIEHALSLQSVLAINGEEQTARAVGKTIGRMALTGVGAALFSKGRGGGIGAGLLDLSVRGVETKSVVNGTIVFQDASAVTYSLPSKEFGALVSCVPQFALSEEAANESREMFDLLGRMKRDGRRSLEELAQQLLSLNDNIETLHLEAENGSTFSARDSARQQADSLAEDFSRQKLLFKAALFTLGLSFHDFIASSEKQEANLAQVFQLQSADPTVAPTKPDEAAQSLPAFNPAVTHSASVGTLKDWWNSQDDKTKQGVLAGAGIILIVALKRFFW
jgi:hypothetical protein